MFLIMRFINCIEKNKGIICYCSDKILSKKTNHSILYVIFVILVYATLTCKRIKLSLQLFDVTVVMQCTFIFITHIYLVLLFHIM